MTTDQARELVDDIGVENEEVRRAATAFAVNLTTEAPEVQGVRSKVTCFCQGYEAALAVRTSPVPEPLGSL